MIRLSSFHSIADAPISEIDAVAVGVSESGTDRHVGIFFRVNESEAHQFIHLAFHHALEVDANPSREFFWCIPELSQRRLRQVAALCRQIATANPRVPYSFGMPSDCFDQETSEFLLGPTKTGLTCASFVLAVFQQSGLPLVVCESWPKPNEEDIEWQKRILKILRAKKNRGEDVSASHLEYIEKEIGTSARYRPEHVAAAAMLRRKRPLRYAMIIRYSRMVLSQIRGRTVKSDLTLFERILCSIPFLAPKRYSIHRT